MTPLVIDPGTHVAILAGGGELPLLIAASVRRRGARVHLVGIKGEADRDIEAYPHTWVNFAEVGRMLTALKGEPDVSPAARTLMVIAGAVKRPDLLSLRPDRGLIPVLFQILSFISAGGDDALLTKAIRVFERQGLTVVGVQDVAPELLLGAGSHGRHHPDPAAEIDLERARDVLDALGDLDVGQGVVVEAGRVLAIEGVEGTDRMLARVAELRLARRAVLLKAPKPRQERRIDLPTIGLHTVTRAASIGINGIGVVAGEALGLQRAAMIEAADQVGLFIHGLPPRPVPGLMPRPAWNIDTLTSREPRLGDRADAERGAQAVVRLAPFATGQAAAVVRGHVLGVSAADTPFDLVARVARQAPWGLARLGRRRGAIVVRALADDPGYDAADLARRVGEAGYAVLAFVVAARDPQEPLPLAVLASEAGGLSLLAIRLAD